MNRPREYSSINGVTREDAIIITEEFSEILSTVKGHCLDIGAGPGDVTVEIILPKLHPSATIVCADISTNMTNFVKEKYKDNDRVSCTQLDIQSPNLPNALIEKFDHVFSYYCLHWCANLRCAIENIYKLLKPGGAAMLAFFPHHDFYNAYGVLATQPEYAPYMKDLKNVMPFYQNCDKAHELFSALVKDVGFEIVHSSSRERIWLVKSDVLAAFLMTVSPFVDRMPADSQEKYQKDMLAELMRIFDTTINEDDFDAKPEVLLIWDLAVMYLKKPVSTELIR